MFIIHGGLNQESKDRAMKECEGLTAEEIVKKIADVSDPHKIRSGGLLTEMYEDLVAVVSYVNFLAGLALERSASVQA